MRAAAEKQFQYPIFYDDRSYLYDMYHVIIPAVRPHIHKFSGIYGVPRGGLSLAQRLSHNLPLPYHHLPPSDKRILIVDDIADTGKTLSRFPHNPKLTLFYHEASGILPDFWFHRKNNPQEWIIFPWENIEYELQKIDEYNASLKDI